MTRRAPRKRTKKAAARQATARATLVAGSNPQIATADGDHPLQEYIVAMPAWKRDVGRRLDALIVRAVPDVQKAVKWNSPFYGMRGQGWFLNFHCFTRDVKVAFFRGSLVPLPPGLVEACGRALPRHLRGRATGRGAAGAVDPTGGRLARMDAVVRTDPAPVIHETFHTASDVLR